MKEISLIIYPYVSSVKIKLSFLPRIGESLVIYKTRYIVTNIWHSADSNETTVFIKEKI